MNHFVFDSYSESSIKEGEIIRRAGDCIAVDLATVDESVPIPHQLDTFWTSNLNKQNLQLLARHVGERDLQNVIMSGMVIDEEIVSARIKQTGSNIRDVPQLNNWQEEADSRVISHVEWAIRDGCEKSVVISNDTDTIALLLHYICVFKVCGLLVLWVQYVTGEKRHMIPLHVLHPKLGDAFCRVVIKAHITTGDDSLSKVGTKHAALVSKPVYPLSNFDESPVLSDADLYMAEQNLVQVWSGARSKPNSKTFDELRFEVQKKSILGLDALPPTSSVIVGHLKRAFYVTRNALTLLVPEPIALDLLSYGWFNQDGTLLPLKCLEAIPVNFLSICDAACQNQALLENKVF